MRAGPNSVLEMISLVNNKGLVHPKPVIKMEITVRGYRSSVKEVVDLNYHQYSFVCVPDQDRQPSNRLFNTSSKVVLDAP